MEASGSTGPGAAAAPLPEGKSDDLISVCFLWPVEETQHFCRPQQLTHEISGHKSDCQHLTHCLSPWTRL